MKFDPLVSEWLSFVENPGFNLVEKALKMAQILEHPDLDVDEYVRRIGRIGMSLREQAGAINDPADRIRMLSEHLFGNLGFDADGTSGMFLNNLIDGRRGTVMCMAVLYAEVARFVGLDAVIFRDAESVMVECGGTVLDTARGRLLLLQQQQQQQRQRQQDGTRRHGTSGQMSQGRILVEMMHDARDSYARMLDYDRALRCTNMILAVMPESPPDIRDRGILECRMSNPEPGLEDLARYLEISPDAEDTEFVLELIDETKQRINQL